MIKLTYNTSIAKLEKIKVGDEIVDEYESQGKVVRIQKNAKKGVMEFTFHLDNKQTIFIISKTADALK